MKSIPVVLLLFISLSVHAETYDDIVDRAFKALEDDMTANWSFTETSQNSDGTFIARFDPRQPEAEQWLLLSVDGRPPTKSELKAFLKDKKRDTDGKRNEEDSERESTVADGSLVLLEETDAHWLFAFKPAADSDDDAKFLQAVDGTLKIIKDGHYVALITLQNSKPIKPGMGIKIQEFQTRLTFAPAHAGGPALPRSVSAVIKGKALLLADIDEAERVEYSEFRLVAD